MLQKMKKDWRWCGTMINVFEWNLFILVMVLAAMYSSTNLVMQNVIVKYLPSFYLLVSFASGVAGKTQQGWTRRSKMCIWTNRKNLIEQKCALPPSAPPAASPGQKI